MRIQNKIMLGAVIFVLCAAAAYAQVGVSSIPVTTVRTSGRAELAGAVRVTANGTTSADTFTVRFGVPITNNATYGMSISTGSGGAQWGGAPAQCTIAGVDNLNGVVTISCSAGASGQYFELDGVRVNMESYPGTVVNATIGANVTTITAGQSSAVVIESIGTGLVLAPTGSAAATLTANGVTAVAGKLVLKEGFASAFKTTTDEGTGETQATQILLTVSGLPTGVTLTGVVNAAGLTTSGLTAAWISGGAFTNTATTGVVGITAESLAAVESLEIDFTPSVGAGVTYPLTATSYTVTATLTPNDAALTAANLPVTTPAYHAPKFAVSNISQTILTVLQTSTNLLIPFASTQATYDTAIAIANTTTDPFGAAGGGATAQNGGITFYFYPNDGSTISSYNTATATAPPGSGLTSGVLTSGSTYTVSLIQLLKAAAPTRTTAFSGYIIAVVQSTDCHGIAYITNYSAFTSYTPLLVIPNPAVTSRSGSTTDEKLVF